MNANTEKTIEDLKKELEEAKANANKCGSSTLSKITKVTIGAVLIAGSAYAGYRYGLLDPNDTTTVVYS